MNQQFDKTNTGTLKENQGKDGKELSPKAPQQVGNAQLCCPACGTTTKWHFSGWFRSGNWGTFLSLKCQDDNARQQAMAGRGGNFGGQQQQDYAQPQQNGFPGQQPQQQPMQPQQQPMQQQPQQQAPFAPPQQQPQGFGNQGHPNAPPQQNSFQQQPAQQPQQQKEWRQDDDFNDSIPF
jgi:hypothetical protein